jgi:MFS family permease
LTGDRLTRRFILLRALRWLPLGLVLPFLIITPVARGLSLSTVGAVFAVHSAVTITLELPSGALADAVGRRRVLLLGASLTAVSLLAFAVAQSAAAFVCSVALLAAGRALISGSLEAWYVDSLRLLDPSAPLARGLSRGTAAEGIAMALGALVSGGLVAIAGPTDAGALSGYGVAALAGAFAALVYLAAVAALIHEAPQGAGESRPPRSIRQQTREVVATARTEAGASVTVRVIFITALALGVSLTAVELLWQPQLAELLGGGHTNGFAFGALAAASMLAVSLGAGFSPSVNRRLGLWLGYLLAIAFAAVCITALGAPGTPVAFASVYLLTYLGFGVAEPMHYELLNEAVSSKARATLMSAESLATQGGALVANLGVGALAATQGAAAVWVLVGLLLGLTGLGIAVPLRRAGSSSRPTDAGHFDSDRGRARHRAVGEGVLRASRRQG